MTKPKFSNRVCSLVHSLTHTVVSTVLLIALAPSVCSATEVYRCQINDRTVYQDTPCLGAANNMQSQPNLRTQSRPELNAVAHVDLTGCYKQQSENTEVWRVQRGTQSPYVLSAKQGKDKVDLPLKVATSTELASLSDGSAQFIDGLSILWPSNATNTKPLGIYRVRERGGKEGVMGIFYMSAGYLTRTKCDE